MPEPMSEIDRECLEYGIELAHAANRAFDYRAAAEKPSSYRVFVVTYNALTSAVGALIGREVNGSEMFFALDKETEPGADQPN